jgi:hypothetical protein
MCVKKKKKTERLGHTPLPTCTPLAILPPRSQQDSHNEYQVGGGKEPY